MVKAVFNNKIVAQSDKTVIVERRHYFPVESVNKDYLKPIDYNTVCPWKGTASYYDVIVDGKRSMRGAWYYPNPSEKAKHIKSMISFWNGVEVIG